MKTITHKNREFQVIEMEPISKYPNLAACQPNVEFTFVAQGKRGAVISGYLTKKGNPIVFDF